MCTSLGYRDAAGKAYLGRTLELTMDLPYQVAFFPAGHETASEVPGHPPARFTAKHASIAVTMLDRLPTRAAPETVADLKVIEGLNDQGLTFSLLSYPSAGGAQKAAEMTRAVLSASDLGAWVLGQFSSVAEVKAALATEVVVLVPLAILGGVVSPFHYVVHDATGASLVIEFDRGKMSVHDNPVGVMTNGPQFDWHLTNLNNYTFLNNVDTPSATFGAYRAAQPGTGIATAGLPASNTSVARFVRAAYYAQFTEKAATPDLAVLTLSHILNTFDRPRGATIDEPTIRRLEVSGLADQAPASTVTEFTCWTSLSDLDRKLFFVRDHQGLNFIRFDLAALVQLAKPVAVPLERFSRAATDGTSVLSDAA